MAVLLKLGKSILSRSKTFDGFQHKPFPRYLCSQDCKNKHWSLIC